jgi:two-component system, NarL family, response regulator LiaR
MSAALVPKPMPEAAPRAGSTATPVRVLIADRHEIVREGLSKLLSAGSEVLVVGKARSAEEALALAWSARPDVVLMDLLMQDMDGVELIRRVRQSGTRPQVLVLTVLADEHHVHGAIEAGAIGYLLRDVLREDLLRAIRDARKGRPCLDSSAQMCLMRRVAAPVEPSGLTRLTARERSVLELVAAGRSNKSIAFSLKVSEGTVKGHVSTLLAKLGVHDRTQAALYALRHGIS